MRKTAETAILLIAFAVGAVGQNLPEPHLISAGLPQYPPIARLAKIQGEVKVEFVLNASGEPISVTAISGNPLLKVAAEADVKTWRFQLPKDLSPTESKYTTTFNFKISGDDQPYEKPKLTVVVDSYRYVEVITNPPSDKYAHDCPAPDQVQPPNSVQDGDFIELSRSGCYGTCPVYEARVSASGEVDWHGHAFVEAIGDRHSNIGAEAARSLLEKFQSPQFWALCGGYDASVTDNPTIQVKVQFAGRSKTVWNYAESAPEFEKHLENAIDATADTHLWRHGEPSTEPLSNIFSDTYLPKPGVTQLMKAAAGADGEGMKSALKSGADIEATDASGWTALMYAAASSHSEPVQLLLAAGANPNHKSFFGDTPLMASAISGAFDEDLYHAGADINAQNSVGVTTLMILASKANSDEVDDALKAGADTFLKDAEGRSALDYLRLANCGRSPIREWHTFETGNQCNHLDKDDVQKVTTLLKNAKRKPRY
jgi:TonB family protein